MTRDAKGLVFRGRKRTYAITVERTRRVMGISNMLWPHDDIKSYEPDAECVEFYDVDAKNFKNYREYQTAVNEIYRCLSGPRIHIATRNGVHLVSLCPTSFACYLSTLSEYYRVGYVEKGYYLNVISKGYAVLRIKGKHTCDDFEVVRSDFGGDGGVSFGHLTYYVDRFKLTGHVDADRLTGRVKVIATSYCQMGAGDE